MDEPGGVPVSKARTASIIGVTGWCCAKPCSQSGKVLTGTKPLLTYGRNNAKNVKPLAASGELASTPTVAENQEMAEDVQRQQADGSDPL